MRTFSSVPTSPAPTPVPRGSSFPRRSGGAKAYLEAGVDCVYPITLWETDPLRRFMSEIRAPVNVTRMPEGPAPAELAALGVARVSWGLFLYWDAMPGSRSSSTRSRSESEPASQKRVLSGPSW